MPHIHVWLEFMPQIHVQHKVHATHIWYTSKLTLCRQSWSFRRFHLIGALLNLCHFICVCLKGGGIISRFGGGIKKYIPRPGVRDLVTKWGGRGGLCHLKANSRLVLLDIQWGAWLSPQVKFNLHLISRDFKNTEIYCIYCNFTNSWAQLAFCQGGGLNFAEARNF